MTAFSFGPFNLDVANHQLTRDGAVLPFKPKAFDTLRLLVENSGRVISKQELLQQLWPDTFVEESSLTQNIYELRRALGEPRGEARYIENVPKRGYRFIAEVRRSGEGGQSIAVLPFRQLGGESDAHLPAGIAEAIASVLGSLRSLTVRPASSSARYAGREPFEAARELQVSSLVNGTIQVVRDVVRVTVELLDVASRSIVWSQRFDGTTADLFALQDAIALRVATALGSVSASFDVSQVATPRTPDTIAYELYLKGRYHWAKATPESLWKALDYFRAATEADPRYPLPWVGIADTYTSLDWYGVLSTRDSNPHALAAARRALELDDTLAAAHASLAMALQYAWDWSGAEHEYRIALAQDPEYAQAHQWYGIFLAFLGRFDEALQHVRRAEELDPVSLSIGAQVAFVFMCARRYDEASLQLQRALELDPESIEARFYLALTLDLTGRFEEAIAVYRDLPQDNPDFLAGLAHALGCAGEVTQARAIIGELTSGFASERTSYVPPFWLAIAQLGIGDVAGALDSLERAVNDPDDSLLGIAVFPQLDPIREQRRFRSVLERMKLQ
jgi:DNA-binding winged helix-turn-helix (wHTH) protein/tetratricopeptide (TPR) repeat protein